MYNQKKHFILSQNRTNTNWETNVKFIVLHLYWKNKFTKKKLFLFVKTEEYIIKNMCEPKSMIKVKYFLWFSFSFAYVRALSQIHKFKCWDTKNIINVYASNFKINKGINKKLYKYIVNT